MAGRLAVLADRRDGGFLGVFLRKFDRVWCSSTWIRRMRFFYFCLVFFLCLCRGRRDRRGTRSLHPSRFHFSRLSRRHRSELVVARLRCSYPRLVYAASFSSHLISSQVGVRFALEPEGDRLLFLEGMREYASKVTPRQKKILGKTFDDEVKWCCLERRAYVQQRQAGGTASWLRIQPLGDFGGTKRRADFGLVCPAPLWVVETAFTRIHFAFPRELRRSVDGRR